MTRATLALRTEADRDRAIRMIDDAVPGTIVSFAENKRNGAQNARLWASLSDVAAQVKWHGLTLTEDDYKLLFLDALKREKRIVPNLDNNGLVSLDRSSSKLTVSEFSDLLHIIYAFGANHGVIFHDPEGLAAEAMAR